VTVIAFSRLPDTTSTMRRGEGNCARIRSPGLTAFPALSCDRIVLNPRRRDVVVASSVAKIIAFE